MIDVDVVDPHHHLWDLTALSYPWLQEAQQLEVHGNDSAIRKNALPSDYRAAFAGIPVVRTVAVDGVAADGLEEAEWLERIAPEEGMPAGVVAGIKLDADDTAARLEEFAALPLARGIRHILNWHDDPKLTYTDRPDIITESGFLQGFARLADLNLSFDLQVYPDQLGQSAELAANHPGTQIILNHAGMPLGRDDESFRFWQDGMRTLAAQPNVTVKVSGLGMTDHRWTVESIRPYVLTTIEIFGVERSMFASNWPVDTLYGSMSVLYDAFDQIAADFSTPERAALFGGNADRVYRLVP